MCLGNHCFASLAISIGACAQRIRQCGSLQTRGRAPPGARSRSAGSGLSGEGLARVDHLRWDAFHEGSDLKSHVEAYRRRYGVYPEAVLGDTGAIVKSVAEDSHERSVSEHSLYNWRNRYQHEGKAILEYSTNTAIMSLVIDSFLVHFSFVAQTDFNTRKDLDHSLS